MISVLETCRISNVALHMVATATLNVLRDSVVV